MIIKVSAWSVTLERMFTHDQMLSNHMMLSPTGKIDTHLCEIDVGEPMVQLFYTNSNDKNGDEIYDGDILKDESGWLEQLGGDTETVLVGFKDGCWMFGRNKATPHQMNTYLWICADKLEKIGNVYENPELIKR